MSKIEYLIRRYVGEYNKMHGVTYWESEFFKYGDVVDYYFKRLRRKGVVLAVGPLGYKPAGLWSVLNPIVHNMGTGANLIVKSKS